MTALRGHRSSALAIVGVALGLLLLGSALPLWSMTLHAPQYVGGLRLIVDGGSMRGDVDELNALNHYIGMPAIRYEDIPEARLFYPAVGAIALGLLLSTVIPWRAFRWLVVLGLWALPVVFLADLQWHLHLFGHSLAPGAAFRLPAFTPKVIGPTVVMNFNVTAYPGIGLICLFLAAAVFTFGPRLLARSRVAGSPVATARGAPMLLAGLALVAPAVGGGGMTAPPAAFDLTAAIALAPPGGVVEVPPGTYRGPVVLTRPITLRGRAFPTIDGGGRGDVVVITGNDVRFEGFRVRGSALAFSREAAGIVVRGARVVVRDNQTDDVLFGIYLAGARDAVIEGNTILTADLPIERRGHAVYLWQARRTRISGNKIMRGKDGIFISFSDDNTVEDNLVSGCRYGIHYMNSNRNAFRRNVFRENVVGAAVMYSTDVTLDDNLFEGSRLVAAGAGLIFKDADRLTVRGNRIVRNRIGLELDNTPATIGGWAKVERNLIAFNDVGFSLMSTAAITATENTLVENLRPVQSRGLVRADANRWTVGGRGNHWSDYAGFDADGDGIGDIPYRRTDLLEDLADRSPPLQAFLFTPAHLALEAASRLVPLVRAEPVVEDRAPLMRPPASAGRAAPLAPDPAGTRSPGLIWIGLGLLLPAAAGLVRLRPSRRRP